MGHVCTGSKKTGEVPQGLRSVPPFLSWASDAYLTHTVDGTSEAVIGNGCVPGFHWPQGLAARGGGEGRLETPRPLCACSALRRSLHQVSTQKAEATLVQVAQGGLRPPELAGTSLKTTDLQADQFVNTLLNQYQLPKESQLKGEPTLP